MTHRWPLFLVFAVGVAVLALYVTAQGPAANPIVYEYRTATAVTATVTGASVDLQAVGVEHALLVEAGAFDAQSGLVVTTSASVTIDAAGVGAGPGWRVQPALVDQADFQADGPIELSAGMSLVALRVIEPPGDFRFSRSVYPLDRIVEAELPVLAEGERVGTLMVELTPIPVTGDERGIPGPVDIPDQRLPRPAVGEAIPAVLASDRQPVWVVGLHDDVAVLDARSPHRWSGLVGWCAGMPGFIDSIGGDTFAATGAYALGPAPHGMVPYEVELAADHVIVTRRLAPPPRFGGIPSDAPFPTIGESSMDRPGNACDIDYDVAAQANEDGYFLEDFRDSPTWVQHDLSNWPALTDADGDGWWRTDDVDVEGLPRLSGDLLVRLDLSRVVDAAAPPGTARHLMVDDDLPAEARTMQLQGYGAGPDGPSVRLRAIIWITPMGAFPATADPPEPRTTVSALPPFTYPLADTASPALQPGDVVDVTIDDGRVMTIAAR